MLGIPIESILGAISSIVSLIFQLIYYMLVVVLPTLIQYIGVPLFLFGCLTGLGLSGAVLFGIIAFFLIYYNYVKKVQNIDPYEKAKEKLLQQQQQ